MIKGSSNKIFLFENHVVNHTLCCHCRMMHDMILKSLVLEVLRVSEKAASLARIVRSEETLFELLVQEKKGDQSNKRFVHDFKTLADVLVQETVHHDLGKKVRSKTNY